MVCIKRGPLSLKLTHARRQDPKRPIIMVRFRCTWMPDFNSFAKLKAWSRFARRPFNMLRNCLFVLLLVGVVGAQTPTEEQAPVTPPPAKPEWRLGFDLGNMTVLETPELQPGNNGEYSAANFRLRWISLSKTRIDRTRLVNPRQWAVLDQHGNVRQREFRWLAAVGGYYLVSTAAAQLTNLQPQQTPRPENVVFGVAGLDGPQPQVRTRLTQTPWKNDAPIERADDLPPNYQAVRQTLYA